MEPTTSIGLLIGLGLRILLEKLRSGQLLRGTARTRTSHTLLFGAWQGVLIFQVVVDSPQMAPAISAGILARLVVDFLLLRDTVHVTRSLIGISLGLLLAGLCAQLWDPDRREFILSTDSTFITRTREFRRKAFSRKRWWEPSALKLPLDAISEEGSDLSSLAREHHRVLVSSEDGEQIASLRAQAAAAAGDRRRLQEERKWAISQGNWARASQLEWQIRKYKALRDSFETEAKRKSFALKRKASRHSGSRSSRTLRQEDFGKENGDVHISITPASPPRPLSTPPITTSHQELDSEPRNIVIVAPSEGTPYVGPIDTLPQSSDHLQISDE